MPESLPRPDLTEQLARWTAAGLIDAGQASRIAAAEAARGASTPTSPGQAAADQAAAGQAGAQQPAAGQAPAARRAPLVVEALGYLGGVLAIVAGFTLVPLLWPHIPRGAELALAAIATVAFWAVGAVLRTRDEPAFRRLRSVLWLLSTASLAAFVGVVAAKIWGLGSASAAVVTTAVATVYAVPLWWRTRSAPQHLAMFVGTALTVGTGIAWLSPGSGPWGPGLGVWGVSALWGLAAQRGYLGPLTAGYVSAGVGLLVGSQLTIETAAGHALGVATVAGLLAAGVLLRRVLLLGFGAVGIIAVVPETATRYLPTSAGAPLAIFVVGLSLLGLALWLAKARKRPPSP
jgi:hypothetical protein